MSAEQKSSRGMPASRRPFKLVALGLAAFVLLGMASLAVLHTPWMQHEMVRQGLKRIERLADVRIETGSCRLSPLTTIHIESLRVVSGGRDFLLSKKVELTFHPRLAWPYVSPQLVLFDQPVIYLEKDDQGRWRIPRGETGAARPRGSRDQAARWRDFPWPEVRVRSGRIIALQDGAIILTLQNLDGTIPYRVVDGARGPAFIIDLGQWR